MERTYLVELIKSLQPGEQADFQKFVAGDYFNAGKQSAEVRQLLRIILEAAPDFLEKDLKKEVVYPRIFQDSSVVEGKLEKLMVELNKLLRTYLLIQRYFGEENEIQQQLDLGAILRERKLENRYQQLLDKTKSKLTVEPWKNAQHFYYEYQLELAFHELESIYNRQKGDLNLSNVLHKLDIFYYINRVEYLNRFLLQQKATNLAVPEFLSFAVQENPVPDRFLSDSTNLFISNKIFHLYKSEESSVADFQNLADLLIEQEHKIEAETLRYFYTYLRSLCTLLINFNDHRELFPILHHIQKDNLSRGYLYYEGQISPSAFISLTMVGIRVKNFEWVNEFVEFHKDKVLGDNESRDFYRFNKAFYLFGIGKYDESLDWIPPTSNYVDYLMMGRRLELKILYEMDSELLPYKMDAFKMFISRASKKLFSDELKRGNADFINLLYQIVQSKPGDKNRVQQLLLRIKTKKWAAERIWLEEKVRRMV